MKDKKKKPHLISMWIFIMGLTISMTIQQYHTHQTHQEFFERQQKILRLYQELDQLLVERIELEKEQSEKIQEILEYFGE